MNTMTASLYVNNNGMTCCIDHGGSYLSSEYQHAPERNTYVTPLDHWERVDEDYATEWTAIVGAAPKCEMCR
jgi:hypothetical protein